MSILNLAKNHIPALRQKTAKEWAGPCPECGGSDRFVIWTDRNAWYCRGCNAGGDTLSFLRRFEGLSCPDAHERLGLNCTSLGCPARDKCRLGGGQASSRPDKSRLTPLPRQDTPRDFVPATASSPEQAWTEHAEKLVSWAHQQLLDNPDQLAFLAARGLPLDAVRKFRLGYLPQDLYRERAAWGLPAETSPRTGKPKKLWLPQGILIPFEANGRLHRIRIRREHVEANQPRYYWLPGSGNDVVVLNPESRACLVVESDLDALACVHAAADLVGAVPLGTCSAKPKEAAASILADALCILVALDFDDPDGQGRRPGGWAWPWWQENYPRAVRWPVPAGKDPGDYVKDHAGDLRAWIEAGLRQYCPAATLPAPPDPALAEPETASEDTPAARIVPQHYRDFHGTLGLPFIVAYRAEDMAHLQEFYPGEAVFSTEEIMVLKEAGKEAATKALLAKSVFGDDTRVVCCTPITEEGSPQFLNNKG